MIRVIVVGSVVGTMVGNAMVNWVHYGDSLHKILCVQFLICGDG